MLIKKQSDKIFVAPAIVIVALMTQVPFLLTIIYSTLRWNLARPDLKIKFTGLANYLYFFRSPHFPELSEFYSIVWQTILMTVGTLGICTVLGFFVALLFDHRIPGINIARTLILGPFFVMSTASGVIWKTTIFNTTFGWYGVISHALGIYRAPDLISKFPMLIIIMLFTWKWMPFFVLVMLAGLQNLSEDLIDATKIDGANFFQTTMYVKLPVISKHVTVAIMLGLIFIVKEFGMILVTTAGGPGTSSYNLPFAVYMQVFNASNVGRAGALAVLNVILALTAVNLIYRILKKQRENYD